MSTHGSTRQLSLEHAGFSFQPFRVEDGFVEHPLVKPRTVQARAYQVELAEKALEESHLLVLPTGLGKTIIAALVAAEARRRDPERKVVVLAPTRPLVAQHAALMHRLLTPEAGPVVTLTGSLPPDRRTLEWDHAGVIASTPQGLVNDVEAGRVRLDDVSLMVFDEAHRAVGNYAYVPLGLALQDQNPLARSLALTASPGASDPRVKEVTRALGIERVAARSVADPDVAPYFPGAALDFVRVPLSAPLRDARALLEEAFQERVESLRKMGFLTRAGGSVGKRALIAAGEALRKRIGQRASGYLFGALHQQLMAVHLSHALELLETQGPRAFEAFLDRKASQAKPSRSERTFLHDPRVLKARRILHGPHPKERELLSLLHEFHDLGGKRALVFAQYRDTVRHLAQRTEAEDLCAEVFIGQATKSETDPGMRQQEQLACMDRFRQGEIDVLFATCIAEEGIDVPDVDLVVFYEPIPSEIRAIQRRGRTGRSRIGRVVILVAEDTRDEHFLGAQQRKEERMHRLIGKLESLKLQS